MKKILFILTILIFQQNLYSQKDIVGKVEYYKSYSYGIPSFDSGIEKLLKRLNSQNQKIEIRQGTTIREFETDSSGIFKYSVNPNEKIFLSINKNSKTTSANFSFEPSEIEDSLKLKISDLRIMTYRDSISAPEFYNKYSEKQARVDFENGNLRIIGGGSFLTKKTIKRREKIAKEYGFRYEYEFGCEIMGAEYRIIHRYNETMKKLIGINKNVW